MPMLMGITTLSVMNSRKESMKSSQIDFETFHYFLNLQKSKNVRSSKLFVFYENQPRVGRKNCSVLWAAIGKNQYSAFQRRRI